MLCRRQITRFISSVEFYLKVQKFLNPLPVRNTPTSLGWVNSRRWNELCQKLYNQFGTCFQLMRYKQICWLKWRGNHHSCGVVSTSTLRYTLRLLLIDISAVVSAGDFDDVCRASRRLSRISRSRYTGLACMTADDRLMRIRQARDTNAIRKQNHL